MMTALLASSDDPQRSRASGPASREDAVLLARVAAGDERAFAVLYDAHRKRLYRLAYGVLLDPNEAREAVQEAFLRLHQAAPDWEPRAQVGTWLYRVVLNHCLSLKQRFLRIARPAPDHGESPARGTPESRALLGEAIAIVEASLASLPIRQRAVACLFLEAELSPQEIAPLVDLTPNATRVTLHRALARLREDLTAAGIDAAPTEDEAFVTPERVEA
jgi:RNA polymerase sigma-70 factor (ECF subfamily)